MLDSKFFFTLVGLILAVFAICNVNMSPEINEGWEGMLPRTTQVQRVSQSSKGCSSTPVKNNIRSILGNNRFVQYPGYQANIEPRFSNVNYGANIRYNMPDIKNLASPCSPVDFNNMAKENYQPGVREHYGCAGKTCGGGCGPVCVGPKCNKGGVSKGMKGTSMDGNPISADANYQNSLSKLRNSDFTSEIIGDGMIQVGNMETINALGETDNTVMYDRLIYSNTKSRLWGLGDLIRGDLAIAPNETGWFSVHPNPTKDLNLGALFVMGGLNNENTKDLAEMVYSTSGGYDTTYSGVPLTMSKDLSSTLSAGQSDLTITSFP